MRKKKKEKAKEKENTNPQTILQTPPPPILLTHHQPLPPHLPNPLQRPRARAYQQTPTIHRKAIRRHNQINLLPSGHIFFLMLLLLLFQSFSHHTIQRNRKIRHDQIIIGPPDPFVRILTGEFVLDDFGHGGEAVPVFAVGGFTVAVAAAAFVKVPDNVVIMCGGVAEFVGDDEEVVGVWFVVHGAEDEF